MRKLTASAAMMVLALFAFASSAVAAPHHPTGEFEQFGDCPLSIETITGCIYSVSSTGSFTIGNKTVPLKNPVTLQGGSEGNGTAGKFYGAEDGNTLSKTKQPVPGGLLGVTAPKWWPIWVQDWFNDLIQEGLTGVNATVELTGPTKGLTNIQLNTIALLGRKGTALGLPAKIHLENPILGSSCYIGSNANPVQINFTTGVSGSLEGSPGTLSANEAFTLLTFTGGHLVDGTFTAPGAEGCGGIFSLFVDPLVNSILGVPSGSGKNMASLEGVIKSGFAPAVRESE